MVLLVLRHIVLLIIKKDADTLFVWNCKYEFNLHLWHPMTNNFKAAQLKRGKQLHRLTLNGISWLRCWCAGSHAPHCPDSPACILRAHEKRGDHTLSFRQQGSCTDSTNYADRRISYSWSDIHSLAVFTDDQITDSRALWKAPGWFVEGHCWEMWTLRQRKEHQTPWFMVHIWRGQSQPSLVEWPADWEDKCAPKDICANWRLS